MREKQDSPILSLLWSQSGNRWGSWVHKHSSCSCVKLQSGVNPSPAALALPSLWWHRGNSRTGLGVQAPAQSTHPPPRDKHAVSTPGMQQWEAQPGTKFNVRIVLWLQSRKLAPADCEGCKCSGEMKQKKLPRSYPLQVNAKYRWREKGKANRNADRSWHVSVVPQYRKQLLDLHLASPPTYYTEFYSNYKLNVVS